MAPIKKIQVGPQAPTPTPVAPAGQKLGPTPGHPDAAPSITGKP